MTRGPHLLKSDSVSNSKFGLGILRQQDLQRNPVKLMRGP